MRAIVGRPVVLTLEVDDANGIPTNVDEDTDVTIDILDGVGATVILGASATDVDISGIYTYTLAPRTQLDTLSITWHATVDGMDQVTYDQIRIVGSRLLTPADIRADPALVTLGSNDRRVLAQVLDSVEDLFADALGYPVALEGTRPNFDARRGTFAEAYAYGNVQTGVFSAPGGLGFGFGGERLIIPGVNRPQQVYSLVINGATVDDDILAMFRPGNGYLIWEGGRSWPSGNYEFWMTHGMPSVPGDLRWAAQRFASYVAKRTPQLGGQKDIVPDRAVSMTTEGGMFVFSRIDDDHPTGLPEVDAVLYRYAMTSVI